jgi:hypothetical protein
MPKLLEEVRNLIRTRHYSYRTEGGYLHGIRQYILFHGKRHMIFEVKFRVLCTFTSQAVQWVFYSNSNRNWYGISRHEVDHVPGRG